MKNEIVKEIGVYSSYLTYRKNALNYTNEDMNLKLENENQVYLAVFDMPLKSKIVGFQILVLIFGLNTHIYHGGRNAITVLEREPRVMKAMQSLLVSSEQVLSKMHLTTDTRFFNSRYVRTYLKTSSRIYYRKLKAEIKEEKFLLMLLNNVLTEINKNNRTIQILH